MYTSASIEKMIAALKREFKSQGLQYRDVAARLKVSEGSIKRYLSGKGITLAALEKLATVVELDLISLATLTDRQNEAVPELTDAQQTALARNRLTRAVYSLLRDGWTPTQIAEEFELGNQINSVMSRLQTLGLIRVSALGIRILAQPKFAERGGGQMREAMIESANSFFANVDLNDPACEWMSYAPRLSRSSTLRLREMIKRFVTEARALTQHDTSLSKDEVQWYRLFVGAQPVNRKKLLRQNN